MAWIFLAELAESPSHSALGSKPKFIVKSTDTPKLFYCPECLAESLEGPQFGTTFQLSKEGCCQKSISSLEDSHVKISVLQEMEQAWQESEADFILKSSDSLGSLGQLSFFSKTFWQSEQEVQTVSSEDFPISGMTVDGRLYQPQSLEPHTLEKDGSFLPTPMARDWKDSGTEPSAQRRKSPSLPDIARRWTTPCADDIGHRQKKYSQGGTALSMQAGGKLNPQWVEWLMGYPTEWTELKDWAMQWFRSKREKRSKDCRE